MKSAFKQPEDSPGFLLWKLTTKWQKAQRNALAPLNLTHVQFAFLASLQWLSKNQDQPVTQAQVAEMSKIDKMVVSETSRKLLAKKLIRRNKHKMDARSYSLVLSAKGNQLLDKALPIVEKIDKLFFKEHKDLIARLNQITSVSS
jgi:DNA-binding MarR family transcriptional regulator